MEKRINTMLALKNDITANRVSTIYSNKFSNPFSEKGKIRAEIN